MRKRVLEFIAEELAVADEQVTENADLIHDLGADSLDIMEMVIGLEEEFEIEIADGDVEKLRRVSDVADLVMRLKN